MKAVQRALATDTAMTSELNRERAAGLGRTARRLEEALDACAASRAELERLGRGPQRTALLAAYATHRAEAERQRWNLEVQREAMGLRRHDELDACYPRPALIRD